MDANVNYFAPATRPAQALKQPAVAAPRPRNRPAARQTPTRTKRRMGREAIKAGMAATLTLSMLTGLRIIKPMSLHGPVSWAFVGLTLAHTLIYEIPNKKSRNES
ncbi:hypothetical protein [Magnetococcus marinus]|nr:hypothetical protein [Magnetococcus marinus]